MGWYFLTFQNPADGLIYDFFGQGNEGLQFSFQALSCLAGLWFDLLVDLYSLLDGFLGHVQQHLVLLFARFLGFIGDTCV